MIKLSKHSRVRRGVAKLGAEEQRAEQHRMSMIRELIQYFAAAGITVRREELKRGIGWRAVSGSCRVFSDRLILLDRHLKSEEQLNFLVSKLADFDLEAPEGLRQKLGPNGATPEAILASQPAGSAAL